MLLCAFYSVHVQTIAKFIKLFCACTNKNVHIFVHVYNLSFCILFNSYRKCAFYFVHEQINNWNVVQKCTCTKNIVHIAVHFTELI